MTLQETLLWHLGQDYVALVSTIETMWQNETTKLSNIIFQVVRYTKIMQRNKKNNTNHFNAKVLIAKIYRVLKKTCITKKYVEQNVTTYYTDQC